MGEASRRKAEISALKGQNDAWMSTLSADEKKIAMVAIAAFEKIVLGLGMTEACYNLAFFLHKHLRDKYSVHVDIVIAWINDGEWDGGASHAWVEYNGKKIDIALFKTSRPDVQPSGDVIILDHVYKRGKTSYKYWKELPETAVNALAELSASSPDIAPLIQHKEREHALMLQHSTSEDGIDEYFRAAPPLNKYESLAGFIKPF